MKTILLIDDEINILKIFSMILNKHGFNVITASTVEEALLLYKNSDFIFVDFYMNGTNTLKLLKEMIKEINVKNICVLSGLEDKDLIKKISKIGISNFLKKPIPYDKILDMINNAI